MNPRPLFCILLALLLVSSAWGFAPDESEQPPRHPPLQPLEGAEVNTNPPSMIWRVDDRAATYTVEMTQSANFEGDLIRIEDIDLSFYNHSQVLDEGTWYWRYFVVTEEGEVSEPSSVRSFIVTADAPHMPVPPIEQIIANLPSHPRIFVTPETLDEFRARSQGYAAEPWADIEFSAERALEVQIPELVLGPMPEDPGTDQRQLFYLQDGEPRVPTNFSNSDFIGAASRANILSMAWLISEDERYAEAAREWAVFNAPFRVDYHLENRANHDTAVYHYEYGLKGIALTYDRLYDRLTEEEREAILDHIIYHADNAMSWIRGRVQIHLNYQNSHAQQCMHPLLVTVLAIADETEETAEWASWLIRQYVNRDAWGSDDGGYSEGQTYGHKFKDILEALAALDTATDIDIFQRPRLQNAGTFWMYCMSLNYWWNHWGDVYSLFMPVPGASADTYISLFLASMTDDPYVTWWSDTVVGNPRHVPLWYVASTGIEPKPPVDIAQTRLFPEVGQLAGYDRFYDHRSNRIFFRSSPFGGHSHAHADQNGFVIHTGGEIMAVDAGYYTYYGDEYHRGFTMATQAHNSILVNGEGQPKSIESKGHFTAFLNSADYTLFTGDAADAYPELLDRFDRTVIFIRPDIFVVYDDLVAPEPSTFDWVFNAHEEVEIDELEQSMLVRQMDQRLRVHKVASTSLSYSQSNERPFPLLTRAWCRVTDAFPQSYHIRATTEQREQAQILAVMDAYDVNDGPAVQDLMQVPADGGLAVALVRDGVTETVIFRGAEAGSVSAGGLETDARAASVGRDAAGTVVRWLVQEATRLVIDGVEVFSAEAACDAAAQVPSPGAAALVQVKPSQEATVTIGALGGAEAVFAAPPDSPEQAIPAAVSAAGGLTVAQETVFWADPLLDLTAPLEPLRVTVTDSDGEYAVELQQSIADNGEIVAWGHFIDPREQGVYDFVASGEGVEILVQDRWEMPLSADGVGSVNAPWREAAEIFIRYAPGQSPTVTAALQDSYRGQLVNLLRNGGFEEGSPDYPPRTWTISHPRQMGYTWPHWTQEDAIEGESALMFVRPEIRMLLRSQPMRLRTGGTYELRFMARGDATQVAVSVAGQHGTSASVAVQPSEEWREYRTELEVVPGYTTININFAGGGDPDQVLWLDDVQFGYIAE